jgi:hypothetical protein
VHSTSLHFSALHFTTLVITSLHYTCHHFTSLHLSVLHFTTLVSTPLHLSALHFFPFKLHPATLSSVLTPFKFPTAPFHLTSLHFTSLHCTFRRFSPHFYSFHFTPSVIAFLTVFLTILSLQGKVVNTSAGSWFQFLMVIFTKGYFPIAVLCFLSLIFRTWSTPIQIVRPSQLVAYSFPSPFTRVRLTKCA